MISESFLVPPPEPPVPTVVNIVSLGHSGSTLLGHILGAHSQIFHLGELVAPVRKGRPLVCYECGCLDQKCPVWGEIISPEILKAEVSPFLESGADAPPNGSAQPGSVYAKLFSAWPGCGFLVDSSKNVGWYLYQSRNPDFAHKYLFLKRNPKAVIASFKRSRGTTAESGVEMTVRRIKQMASFYASIPKEDSVVVSYEGLVTKFESEVEGLCRFLGIAYEPEVSNFSGYPHHLIGGNQASVLQKNRGFAEKLSELQGVSMHQNAADYYGSFKGLKLDERWKQELSREEIEYIDEALPEESCYGY